jgi:hypothetical protein
VSSLGFKSDLATRNSGQEFQIPRKSGGLQRKYAWERFETPIFLFPGAPRSFLVSGIVSHSSSSDGRGWKRGYTSDTLTKLTI